MGINNISRWIKEYWIVIIAITGFFYYFYKKEIVKLEIWQNEYFDKILVPFHMQYLKNTAINVRKFMNRIDIYSKEYVPSYLFYLVKQNEYDKIRKILIVDYENNYPSQKRISLSSQYKAMNAIGFFGEIGIILIFTILFLLFCLSIVAIIAELVNFFQNNAWSTINNNGTEILAIYTYITVLLLCIFIGIIVTIHFRMNDYTDCYSSKKKIINKLIKQKIKHYGKIYNKLIY